MNSRPVFPLPSHKLLFHGQELKFMSPAEHHSQVLGPWAYQHATLTLTDPLWAFPLGWGLHVPFVAAQAVSLGGLVLNCASDPGMLTGPPQWGAQCSSSEMPLCCPPPCQLCGRKAHVVPWSHLNLTLGWPHVWSAKEALWQTWTAELRAITLPLMTGTNMRASTTCWTCRQVRG